MFSKECIHCENMIDCTNPVGEGCINFKGKLTKEVNNNKIDVDRLLKGDIGNGQRVGFDSTTIV